MKKLLTALAILTVSTTCSALDGKVVGVIDGDTIDLLDANNRTHRIRFAETDSPERRQAFGQRAKHHLSQICFGKTARFTPNNQSSYDRLVGYVSCNGVDANLKMAQDGFAWVDSRYAKTPSLIQAVENAKRQKIGLWSDPNPIPPWMWRRAHK